LLCYGRPCTGTFFRKHRRDKGMYQEDESVTSRTFFAMLMFAGIIGAVMWFFVLPALTTYRPSVP
jgi:hypothetical protein